MEIEISINDYLQKDIPTHVPFERKQYKSGFENTKKINYPQYYLDKHEKSKESEREFGDSQLSSHSKNTTASESNDEQDLNDFHAIAYKNRGSRKEYVNFGESKWYSEIKQTSKLESGHSHSVSQEDLRELSRLSIYYTPPVKPGTKVPTLYEAYISLFTKTMYAILVVSLISCLIWTIFWDVDKRLSTEIVELHDNIYKCEVQYAYNHCDRMYMLEEMQASCKDLYNCMSFKADNHNIYSKLKAGQIAEVISCILQTLSYAIFIKFILIVAVGMIIEIPCAQIMRLYKKGFKLF